MTEKEIIRVATEYKKNKRQIEALEKDNERIKALLVDELKERGGDSPLVAGQYKISQSSVKNKTTLLPPSLLRLRSTAFPPLPSSP